eukprot:gene5665-5902_t
MAFSLAGKDGHYAQVSAAPHELLGGTGGLKKNLFYHLGMGQATPDGKSGLKHTVEIIHAWAGHPDLPPITIVSSSPSHAALLQQYINSTPADQRLSHSFHTDIVTNIISNSSQVTGAEDGSKVQQAPAAGSSTASGGGRSVPGSGILSFRNIRLVTQRLSRTQHDVLLASIGMHICTSSKEGFGHYINQARAVGALLLTTAYPPMEEFVGEHQQYGLLCSFESLWPEPTELLGQAVSPDQPRIDVHFEPQFFVEFGTQDGSQCTTRFLREAKNWTGLLMDGGFENSTINLHREMIYAENIVSLFQKYRVPHPSFDLLTVDIDLNTAYLLRAVLAGGYRPRMMVVEYNRNFAPDDSYVTAYTPDEVWSGTCYFGGSGLALERIAKAFGYSLVAFDRIGLNVYFVRNDILGMPFPHSFASLTKDPSTAAWESLHEACRHNLWMYVEDSSELAGITWMSHLFPVLLSHRDSSLVLSPQQRQELQKQLQDLYGPKSAAAAKAPLNASHTSPGSPPVVTVANNSQSLRGAVARPAATLAATHKNVSSVINLAPAVPLPPAPAFVNVRTFYEIRLTAELVVLPCGTPRSSGNGSSVSSSNTAAALVGGSESQVAVEQSLTTLSAAGGVQLRYDNNVTGLDSHRRRRHACRVQWLQYLKAADVPSCE